MSQPSSHPSHRARAAAPASGAPAVTPLAALADRLVSLGSPSEQAALMRRADAQPATVLSCRAASGPFVVDDLSTICIVGTTHARVLAVALMVTTTNRLVRAGAPVAPPTASDLETAAMEAHQRAADACDAALSYLDSVTLHVHRVPTRTPHACYEVVAPSAAHLGRVRVYIHEAKAYAGLDVVLGACPLTGAALRATTDAC